MKVTINCDMGESFGIYKLGDDEALMGHVNLANVACGFHASDPTVMARTVKLAKKYGVQIGAHPSLPDRQGFGRREMKLTSEELTALIIYQVGALKGFLDAEGMTLSHIKPHGSLYGMSARSEEVANAICDAVEIFDVPVLGMSGTMHEQIYLSRNISFVPEFYADLDYDDNGALIITREHKAAGPAATATRALHALQSGTVKSINGVDISVKASTVCIHSDTPGAEMVAKAVKEALRSYL